MNRIPELVRQMADRFREEKGTIICRELLGVDGREESVAPSARTPEYYASSPCSGLVECAARILEDTLFAVKKVNVKVIHPAMTGCLLLFGKMCGYIFENKGKMC